MIFFLKKEKFLLDKRDVTVEYEKRLNSKEYKLFSMILDKFIKNTEDFIFFNKDKLMKELKIPLEKLENFNFRLLEKKVVYSVNEGEKLIVKGNFNILNSFAIQGEEIIYSLSQEIKISLTEKNFFNRIHLISLLKFKSKYTSFFYLNHLMRLGDFSEFEIDLLDLKSIFNVSENYERFFDFEKNILKPILDDINNFTEYYLTYDKIKNSGNKIEKIKFKGTNKYSKYIKKRANDLLYSVRDNVDDFNSVYNEIYMNLMRKGYNYVFNNLQYCLKNHESKFSDNFKKILEENPTNSKIEKEIDMESLNDINEKNE